MADSDDEYDRKRRDKFQGERSESYRTSDRRKEESSREQWSSRQRVRTDYRDRYSQQYQNDMPPAKRIRYDMEDRRMRFMEPSYPSYGSWPDQSQSYMSSNSRSSDMETQPPIMTFKAFLQTQDDNITDEEAIAKYAEYKLEFRRQQLNEFFVAHKEEEWFKLKYHPEESQKRKDEHLDSLKKRAGVFQEMLDTKRVDGVKVDADSGDNVVKLLDTVVIRLEGGTDLDITILDQPPDGPNACSDGKDGEGKSSRSSKDSKRDGSKDRDRERERDRDRGEARDKKDESGRGSSSGDAKRKDPEIEPDQAKKTEPEDTSAVKEDHDNSDKDSKMDIDDDDDEEGPDEPPGGDKLQPKTELGDDVGGDTSEKGPRHSHYHHHVHRDARSPDTEEDDDEDGNAAARQKNKKVPRHPNMDLDERPPGVDPESESEKDDEDNNKEETAKSPVRGGTDDNDTPEIEAKTPTENADSAKNGENDEADESKKETDSEAKAEKTDKTAAAAAADISEDTSDEVVPLTPRPLHRTSSIFLRTISPRITKAEIETICKRYPGFLRVSLADPQPEQQWFRRGWVTFRRDVNVKDICWSLNNIRVRDCELGAIVNRDLSRRVRTVSGLSAMKQVVLHDIKLCAKLIQDLDARAHLWQVDDSDSSNQGFGLVSANPVLKGITDFLVDEASAEEEELLGTGSVTEDSKERHNAALKVLDRLLLYLRIVHSVDFYNQSHYPNEDEMPNRCGIMHLRGTPSSTDVPQTEMNEYMEGFRSKLTSLLAAAPVVEETELASLGAKSQETEVEKFIQANTQELAKDKWLCPLSGKKFKGPEFVRKHIFNKFKNELEEVRKEVDYFNNYLRDPKRPQLAEHPGNRSGKKDSFPDSGGYNQSFNYGGGYRGRGGYSHYGGPGGYGGRGSRGYPRGRGMDYRPVITYRDLDAPCEPEEII